MKVLVFCGVFPSDTETNKSLWQPFNDKYNGMYQIPFFSVFEKIQMYDFISY